MSDRSRRCRALLAGAGALDAKLAQLREKTDRAEAEDTARQAAGNPYAWTWLAELRERAGDQDGVEQIRRFGITADGHPEQSL